VAGLGIGAIVVVYILRRRWVSTPATRAEADDDRIVLVDWSALAAPWRWRPSRGSRHEPPHDAVRAYREALAKLNTDTTTSHTSGV
jgi:hypothetical protein